MRKAFSLNCRPKLSRQWDTPHLLFRRQRGVQKKNLAFPDTLVAEFEGRLRVKQKLLGKIVGLMFTTLFGCRHAHELTWAHGRNDQLFYPVEA